MVTFLIFQKLSIKLSGFEHDRAVPDRRDRTVAAAVYDPDSVRSGI